MIAISHGTQTPKLGSSFCSIYTGMKQRSKPSVPLTLHSAIYMSCYPLAAATATQPKVQLFLSPCLGVHSPSNLLSMTPSHSFQMVYSSFVYCTQIKVLVSRVASMGGDQGLPCARQFQVAPQQIHHWTKLSPSAVWCFSGNVSKQGQKPLGREKRKEPRKSD